jgi:uncharacterized protein YndB with AHSA1/START domain
MRFVSVLLAALCSVVSPAAAAVASHGSSGFELAFEGDVPAAPADAYAKFLDIAQWWSADHTYSGSAANLAIAAVPGGCWCESLPAGGFVQHMQVVNAQPGVMLVFSGGLGPLQFMGVAGSLVATFEARDGGTHVTLRYAVGGYAPDNFAKLPAAVDGVLGAGFTSYLAFAAK